MISPFLLMTLLYLFAAILAAIDASLVSYELLPWFQGLRWLRVHFITLGMLTEATFGAMPVLVATRLGVSRPRTRWDTWLTLNVGLLVLIAGIPSINQPMIFVGGTLVFVAAALLAVQLWRMRASADRSHGQSVKFYVTGLAFLLLGIIVGTGLWLGWSGPLRIQIPLETHIHANNWGFLSLVFAGLLVDVLPYFSGRPMASTRTISGIFWGMALGAFGLVLGPWLGGSLWFTVPGILLHLAATITLLVVVIRMLASTGQTKTAGAWHLITSYLWILTPIMMAPLIILGLPGVPAADIEATAPQALIYGWALQFGFAMVPFMAARFLLSEKRPRLGGNWLSLTMANLGSALIWTSIFLEVWRGQLQGAGYLLYLIAMIVIAVQLSGMMHRWYVALESDSLVPGNT